MIQCNLPNSIDFIPIDSDLFLCDTCLVGGGNPHPPGYPTDKEVMPMDGSTKPSAAASLLLAG